VCVFIDLTRAAPFRLAQIDGLVRASGQPTQRPVRDIPRPASRPDVRATCSRVRPSGVSNLSDIPDGD
jgi:hypothetical protein